jgi:BolA protein
MAIMTGRYDRIRDTLLAAFKPSHLEIIDESDRHAGHAHRLGAPEAGETHYRVVLISDAFAGQPRIARSRKVHEVLEAEFKSGLHALSLGLKTPQEAAASAAES